MTEKYIMSENSIPDGILHDQCLCDISLQDNELALMFKTRFYPQDYTDTSFTEKIQEFHKMQYKMHTGR